MMSVNHVFKEKYTAEAVSGVATVDRIQQNGPEIQVAITGVTGTGNATLTVRPGDSDEFVSIAGSAIVLTDPIPVIIRGRITAVRATSDNNSDEFTMEVRA